MTLSFRSAIRPVACAHPTGETDDAFPSHKEQIMRIQPLHTPLLAIVAALVLLAAIASAQAQAKKPNIVFIMGDDIGMWNIGAYHRGLMAGRTPNLDVLARQGMLFTD